MNTILKFFGLTLSISLFLSSQLRGEGKPGDFRPVKNPFGDPSTYEFAEDEKADKEFFHLGRFFMIGFDVGAGVYTGGLGRSVNPGAYFGARIIYFFDRSIAFEAAVHYSKQLDVVTSPTLNANIDTTLVPLTLGFRYYFNTKESPKAIAMANPYLAFGGGAYLREQQVLFSQPTFNVSNANNSQFGAYGGVGVEFAVYRKHLYLGLDLRYHLIFFFDEEDTLGNAVAPGDRSGDYFTPAITLTYSF